MGEYAYKPEYGYTTSATEVPTGPKFLRITDIQDAGVNWNDVPYCQCDDKARQAYRLKEGDIVIARIGATTGKSFLIRECPEAIFASYLIRIRTKANLHPDFLNFFCQTEDYWRQVDQSKGGRLKFGVNIPILQNLVFPLPSVDEQREIADILNASDAKITALEQETILLEDLFRALLEELMTGRLSTVPLVAVEVAHE